MKVTRTRSDIIYIRVLHSIRVYPKCIKQISDEIGVHYTVATRYLRILRVEGLVEHIQLRRVRKPVIYTLTKEGRIFYEKNKEMDEE